MQALHRVAARSAPTYRALVQAVRHSPVVAPDETGWKVGGRLWWLWVFVTPEVTVYTIQPGRGPRRYSARAIPASSCATAGLPTGASSTLGTRPVWLTCCAGSAS